MARKVVRKATKRKSVKKTTKKKTPKKKVAKKSTKKKTLAKKKPSKKKVVKKKTTKKTPLKKKPKKRIAKKKVAKKVVKKKTAKKATPKKVVKAAPEPVIKLRKSSKPKNARTLSYTQSEFVENVRAFCGLSKKTEAKVLCEDMALLLTDCLKNGYRVPLLGLGKLYVRQSKARMGRNPATGAPIRILAKRRVRFSPSKALKDSISK